MADVTLTDAPNTSLWSVAYDVDDNDRIDFGDLAYFANEFQEDVFNSDSPLTWALDFDKNGKVDFGDLAFLATNLGSSSSSISGRDDREGQTMSIEPAKDDE